MGPSELKIIAKEVAKVEKTGIFNEEELKLIRSKAFVSWVDVYTVCVPASVTAKILSVTVQTIRRWCREDYIICPSDENGWWEIPLDVLVDLKYTDGDIRDFIPVDIEKVDF